MEGIKGNSPNKLRVVKTLIYLGLEGLGKEPQMKFPGNKLGS